MFYVIYYFAFQNIIDDVIWTFTVITTYREPVTGWIDNMYGPCGVIVGIGSGVLRVFTGDMDNKAHIVPVDMCVNALLASAWDIARNKWVKICQFI